MSVLDKVIAAVTPPETDEARRTAREKARASATPGDWLQIALDHNCRSRRHSIPPAPRSTRKSALRRSRRWGSC